MTLENLRFRVERDDIWWRLLSCWQRKSRGPAKYPIQHEYNYRHPRVGCRITCLARSYAPRKFLPVPACCHGRWGKWERGWGSISLVLKTMHESHNVHRPFLFSCLKYHTMWTPVLFPQKSCPNHT